MKNEKKQIPPVSVIRISMFQGKVSTNLVKPYFCILRYVYTLQKLSGLGPLRSNRRMFSIFFFCCSKESYGCEAVFVPDVDYSGDFYRTRNSSKK